MIRLRPSPAELLEKLKQAKDARQASFFFDGAKYQSDPLSLSAVLARAGVCEPYDTIRWIAADNQAVPMRGSDFVRFARAMAAHVDGVMSEFNEKRKQIVDGDIVDPDDWEHN